MHLHKVRELAEDRLMVKIEAAVAQTFCCCCVVDVVCPS